MPPIYLYNCGIENTIGRPQKPRVAADYWLDQNTCRKFFCDLAAAKGFDPFVAENWKRIKYEDIRRAGVRLLLFVSSLFTTIVTKGLKYDYWSFQ
jgi:hypothetical protein